MEGATGVIFKSRTGKKSQVSSKCSRVRFSEMSFYFVPSPFHQNNIKMQFMSIVKLAVLPVSRQDKYFVRGAKG